MKKTLVVIVGPTAVGKTKISLRVAQRFNTEIISADARQLYQGMRIGTAAPSQEDLSLVRHHFIHSIPLTTTYSAGDFEHDALLKLDSLFKTYDVVVMAGGSGLFVRALISGLDAFPAVDKSVTKQLKDLLVNEGIGVIRQMLIEKDPEYASTVDLDNPHRLIRALSVCICSGKPYSSFRKGKAVVRSFNNMMIGLHTDRKKLYERIDARVDRMMSEGLLEEVRALQPFAASNALQTVGYQELLDYLEGKLTLQEAVALIKQHSRNYAKRQLTWFRREKNITWFDAADEEGILAFLHTALPQ